MKMTSTVLILCLGFTAWAFDAANASDATKPKEYSVRDFGAKGDGKTLDTTAIQKALDECSKAGGGIVRLPAGAYLSQPISLHSKTTLQLDEAAMLKATDEPADFANPDRPGSFVPFISGKALTDVTIAGHGTIDGSGAKWWAPAEEARRKQPGYTLPRPRLIILTGCKNVRVQDVTLQNSPTFHFVPTDCEGVVITNVTFKAPSDSPNTDAIDPSVSRRVLITKCVIDVGDDNVAIKSGKKMAGREFACEDITVTDCVFKHGHGMSIGSETVGGVRNVLVKNCTFEETENGIRIKSPRGRGGIVENLICEDITMKNVAGAITITCYYPKIPQTDTNQVVDAETPKFRNIRITNLKATSTKAAGVIVGLPVSMVENVLLENVQISAATTGLTIRNAKGVQFKNVQVNPKQGPPFIVEDNAQVAGWERAKDK